MRWWFWLRAGFVLALVIAAAVYGPAIYDKIMREPRSAPQMPAQ